MKRNRRYLEATGDLVIDPTLPEALVGLLFESETSGGLFFSVSRERAGEVIERFGARGEPCWEIGEAVTEPGIRVA